MLVDEELMLRVQQGDRAALELLVTRYHGPIRNYLWRMSQNQATADDLCQDCFLRLLERAHQYEFPRPFKPWLYRIASNLCRDMWRSQSWQDSKNQLPEELGSVNNVQDLLERQMERQAVVSSLAQLEGVYREIIVLRFYNDLKLEDIAQIIQLPTNTVKTRLYRGLKQLKQIMDVEVQGIGKKTGRV